MPLLTLEGRSVEQEDPLKMMCYQKLRAGEERPSCPGRNADV